MSCKQISNGVETIETLDREVFFAINGFNSEFFDSFFWIVSLVITWVPLYVFFTFLMVRKFGKNFWIPLLAAGLLAVATDQGSVFLKNTVQRYRPTHNLEIQENVHKINNDRGGKFGFVSSHAANTWGLAVYLIFLFNFRKKYFSFLLLLWAALVSYGRVYAGVHYPLDVIGGGMLGAIMGFITYKLQYLLAVKYLQRQAA